LVRRRTSSLTAFIWLHRRQNASLLARWPSGADARKLSSMADIFHVLILVALAAVTTTLGVGIFALFRGGEFGRSWSNRLMRLRVLLQFTAVILLCCAYWFSHHGH
jgi:hypothetical protein